MKLTIIWTTSKELIPPMAEFSIILMRASNYWRDVIFPIGDGNSDFVRVRRLNTSERAGSSERLLSATSEGSGCIHRMRE